MFKSSGKVLLIFLILFVLIVSGCSQKQDYSCPDDCDDNDSCTRDYCSEATNYTCMHDNLLPCCGNGVCEDTLINIRMDTENHETCPEDCKDPCEGIECNAVQLTCPDGFNATCQEVCVGGACAECTPDCTGHNASIVIITPPGGGGGGGDGGGGPPPDTTPPVISNINVIDINSSAVIVSFDSNKIVTAEIMYGTNQSNLSDSASSSMPTSSISITLSNLTYDTTYYYQITAQDSSGNPQTTGIDNFTTRMFRFIHMTDTHIITDGNPNPGANDGRTDWCIYPPTFPEFYALYCNTTNYGSNGGSTLPTIAMMDAVDMINGLDAEFTVITGDLVAQGPFDSNKTDSVDKLKEIVTGLESDYYAIAHGNFHDNASNNDSADYYENAFGDLIWNFTGGDNLFIGLTNNLRGASAYATTFLNQTLYAYANQNMSAFVFMHRLPTSGDIVGLMDNYSGSYKSSVAMGGHWHRNDYDFYNNTHWIDTTAIMNYPTEFRIVDIYQDRIEIYMSDIVSIEVNNVSETKVEYYINNSMLDRADPPDTKEGLAGNESERSINITFS
jgi:hypothetical protein